MRPNQSLTNGGQKGHPPSQRRAAVRSHTQTMRPSNQYDRNGEKDTGAAAATDALVETHGPKGALDELRNRRRSRDTDTARAHEALAYLKFAYEVPA